MTVSTLRQTLLFLILALAASSARAANPFYTNLLSRGVANVEAGILDEGVRELQIAAFGLLDEPADYQRAQIYIALANEKLGRTDAVRQATGRFLQVERRTPAYADLSLPPSFRAAFDKLLSIAMGPENLASIPAFRRSPPSPQIAVATTGETPVPPREAAAGPARDLARAAALLEAGNAADARKAYWAVTQKTGLTRSQLLEAARGLSRSASWLESTATYQRTQPFLAGEEIHMYREAVNRAELGELAVARFLFSRAESALPKSREVEGFRARLTQSR